MNAPKREMPQIVLTLGDWRSIIGIVARQANVP